MAYYMIEPWGDRPADLRQAITSMILANKDRGKNQRAFKVEDFIPVKEPKKPQDWREMQDLFRQNFSKGKE